MKKILFLLFFISISCFSQKAIVKPDGTIIMRGGGSFDGTNNTGLLYRYNPTPSTDVSLSGYFQASTTPAQTIVGLGFVNNNTTLAGNTACAYLLSEGGVLKIKYRNALNGQMTTGPTISVALPLWLKTERTGNDLLFYYSNAAASSSPNYTLVGSLPNICGSWSQIAKTFAIGSTTSTRQRVTIASIANSNAPPAIACTAITSTSISGNSSVSGTSATYNAGYLPASATAPSAYNWSISGQGTSIQGGNNGLNCSFNFGTSGNATITLSMTTCNGQVVTTTKTVSQTPVVASAQKVFIIRNNTAGFGNDPNRPSGFNQSFETNIQDFKTAGVDAIRLTYHWEEIETSPNNYSTAMLQKQIEYCLANNLKFSICVWFYNRDGITNSAALNALAKQVYNDGSTNNRGFDFNDANTRSHLQAGTAALANLINNNQTYKDNFLSFLLGNGVTEEFYCDYKNDASVSPGNYSAASLTAWRQFLFAKYGATTPYFINGINVSGNMPFFHLDGSNAPTSHSNGLNSQAGKDWQYFIADGLKKLFVAFKNGMKGVNSNFQAWYFPTAWHNFQTYQIELMWFAHFAIIEEADGVYSSCNEFGAFSENLLFMDNMATTWPNKHVGLEFDTDDVSLNGGGLATQFGATPTDFEGWRTKSIEFIKRANPNTNVYLHFAMSFGNGSGPWPNGQHNQIAGFQPKITDIKANYAAGQNRYNRVGLPAISGSMLNYMNTDYWRLRFDWSNISGQNFGNPINFLLTP